MPHPDLKLALLKARAFAMPDGPQKKFYLIKAFGLDLLELGYPRLRELSCAEISALIVKHQLVQEEAK